MIRPNWFASCGFSFAINIEIICFIPIEKCVQMSSLLVNFNIIQHCQHIFTVSLLSMVICIKIHAMNTDTPQAFKIHKAHTVSDDEWIKNLIRIWIKSTSAVVIKPANQRAAATKKISINFILNKILAVKRILFCCSNNANFQHHKWPNENYMIAYVCHWKTVQMLCHLGWVLRTEFAWICIQFALVLE